MSEQKTSASAPFLLLAAIAIVLGIYGRFKGLGFAPVSPDEYYLARGVDSVLKFGIPAFDCGGYYQRGIALQYIMAGLRLLGLSPELAARSVCAFASLLTLPAAYLIGRRFLSANLALVAVSILALSVWEVEIARFGRMYAPFQAVFTWYLVYFLRYAVDRKIEAMRGMLALTLLGALVWEGAVFLALANFIPAMVSFSESRRLQKNDWTMVGIGLPLLAGSFYFATANMRFWSDIPPYPAGYSKALTEVVTSKLDLVKIPLPGMGMGAVWLGIFAVALIVCAVALRWVWSIRARPVLALGLLAMMATALVHQFAATMAIFVVLLLLRELTLKELVSSNARACVLTIFLAIAFWTAYGLAHIDWPTLVQQSGSSFRALGVFAYQFFRFPNVVGDVVRPFVGAVPILSALLGAALIASVLRTVISGDEVRSPERILLLLFVLLLVAVALGAKPRQETRYVAFLYPLAILFVVVTVDRLIGKAGFAVATRNGAAAVIVLALFFATEDMSLRHLLNVDSPQITFRADMKPALQSHLEIRNDVRGIAQWLKENASPEQDAVINGVHGFDYYFPGTRYFFVDEHDPNFPDWSCHAGTKDRWTNLPLIYTVSDLKAKTASFRTTYLVTFTLSTAQMAQLADRNATIVATNGLISLVRLERST